MKTVHPVWCLGIEQAGYEHVSETLHAAGRTDITDIGLRPVQLEDVTSLRLELMEDEQSNVYLLPLEQARALVATVNGLLAADRAPVPA